MELLGYIITGLSLLWLSRYLLIRSKVAFKLITISLVGALIFSQYINNHRQTHPFANWSMYSSPFPASHYKEFLLVNIDGESFPYPFELVNRVNHRPLMTMVSNLEDDFHRFNNQDSDTTYSFSKLDEIVESLVDIYEQVYPERDIAKFKINVVMFNVDSVFNYQIERFNSYTYQIR